MEYRQLGRSGLKVPALSLGTGTFGGTDEFFGRWGDTDGDTARRLVDVCIDAGVNLFDSADVYSGGDSEVVLGQALKGRRDQALISTKATFAVGAGPNDEGSSRFHLIRQVEQTLRRLGTDYIDIYTMHGGDTLTPVEETVKALESLIESGKVRYVGCSNFSAWQVMKSLGVADRHGFSRYISYQGYYSLLGREIEWEVLPMARDQGLGLMAWSPLGWGRLTGKIRRGQPSSTGRIASGGDIGSPPVPDERLFSILDVVEEIGGEVGATVSQVAIAWLLGRPSVSTVIVGARTEEQLRTNLQAATIELTDEHRDRLTAVSEQDPIYPFWHQRQAIRTTHR